MEDILSKNAKLTEGAAPEARPPRLKQFIAPVLGAALFALSLVFIRETLSTASLEEIIGGLWSLSLNTLALGATFTAISYVLLLTYDIVALRASRVKIPVSSAAHTGFIACAMSQTLGFGMLTGGAVRLRLYGALGVPASDIVGITVVAGFAFWLGLGTVAGVSLVAEPQVLVSLLGVPSLLVQGAGALLGLLIASYLFSRIIWAEPLTVAGWRLPLPDFRTALLQTALGAADMIVSAAALWVLLPPMPDAHTGFLAFAGIYAIITIAGYVSHIPGGLGVVEAGVLLAFPNIPAHSLLASLLVFRVIYYILPFALALSLLAIRESRPHFSKVRAAVRLARPLLYGLLPSLIAAAVFTGGLVLLVSGAMPAIESRMEILRDFLPLPFIEASHLLGSVAGFFLLILSVGLYRRLDAAWTLTCLALCCGIAMSLFKGLDWEEATILSAVLSMAVANRKAFYRQSSLLNEDPSLFAIAAVVLACSASLAVGFAVFAEVDYSNQLWWQVAYSADAPRFLRASLMVILAAGGMGAYLMLRPSRRSTPESYQIPAEVPRIVNLSESTEANLALTGDKRFLVAPQGDAFLMYDVQGTSWVAMGDPIGNAARFTDLLWAFRELVDRPSRWP